MNNIKTENLFDLSHTIAEPILRDCEYPWQVLPKIKAFVCEVGKTLSGELYDNVGENIWIAKSAVVAPSATIIGPCIIGERTEVRVSAFIRGCVIVGCDSVIGNSCELKNCIIFDNVQVPHFNYVGDSVLGYRSHMGAGAVTSNVKSDKTNVCIKNEQIETGFKKFGAMLGDFVEVGCNSVLNPGTIIGRNTNIYPLSSVRGVIPSNSIFKRADQVILKIKK